MNGSATTSDEVRVCSTLEANVIVRSNEFCPFPSLSGKSISHFFSMATILHHNCGDIAASPTVKSKSC